MMYGIRDRMSNKRHVAAGSFASESQIEIELAGETLKIAVKADDFPTRRVALESVGKTCG